VALIRSHGKLLKLLRPGAGPAAPILPLCPGLPEKMIDVSDAIRRRRELSISRIRLDVLIWRCCQFDLESARKWDDFWATSVPRLSNRSPSREHTSKGGRARDPGLASPEGNGAFLRCPEPVRLSSCRHRGRRRTAMQATYAANAKPRSGASSWSQALNQQTIFGASPRSFGQGCRRASTILANDVLPDPMVR